jgi:L-alanine-DL-glutamate epimerase-like enolase superfamily enzyme
MDMPIKTCMYIAIAVAGAVCTLHDAFNLVKVEVADVFALKLTKAGGFAGSKAVAATKPPGYRAI